MKIWKAWKAFRIDKKRQLRFLFHTYKGSSLVPLNEWIETKRPWVSDGSGKPRKYRAGFHFFYQLNDCERFNKITKNKYLILPVLVSNISPKPHSSVKAWLAKSLYVPMPQSICNHKNRCVICQDGWAFLYCPDCHKKWHDEDI